MNERDGVLVLSRNAGAFEELADWVVPVDPLDVEGQAEALREALGLDAGERRRRLDGDPWPACASTTSSTGSTRCSPTSTPRPRANGLPRRGSLLRVRARVRRARIGRPGDARRGRPRAADPARGGAGGRRGGAAGAGAVGAELVGRSPGPSAECRRASSWVASTSWRGSRRPRSGSRCPRRTSTRRSRRSTPSPGSRPRPRRCSRRSRCSPGVPYLLHKRIELLHEPCGVVAVVAPWNFPFAIPFVQAATAVAAGNAVVVKPSELTPLTGALIEDVFRAAGAPGGLVRVVQGASGPRRGARRCRRAREGRVHGLGRRGPFGRGRRRRAADAGHARARREASDARPRRCRPRPRRRGRDLGLVRELRPGLRRGRADLRRRRAPRRLRGPSLRRGARPADRPRRRARDGARAARVGAAARPRGAAARADRGRDRDRRPPGRGRSSRLVPRADGRLRHRERRPAGHERDLRAGRHRRLGSLRGRGGPARERVAVRARRERLDARPGAGPASGATPRRRHGLDERRRLLVGRRPRGMGWTQGLRLRDDPVAARALRGDAAEARRPGRGAGAGAVVVPRTAPTPRTAFERCSRRRTGAASSRARPRRRGGGAACAALARRYAQRP